ncbi:MAG: hypothetical protein U0N25_10855, partial [Agathobaculum butyriciproducens]
LPGISPLVCTADETVQWSTGSREKVRQSWTFQGIESAYCGTPLPALARTAEKRHTVRCAFLYALVYVLLFP